MLLVLECHRESVDTGHTTLTIHVHSAFIISRYLCTYYRYTNIFFDYFGMTKSCNVMVYLKVITLTWMLFTLPQASVSLYNNDFTN